MKLNGYGTPWCEGTGKGFGAGTSSRYRSPYTGIGARQATVDAGWGSGNGRQLLYAGETTSRSPTHFPLQGEGR